MVDTPAPAVIPVTAQPITSSQDLQRELTRASNYRPVEWVRNLDETRMQYEGDVLPLLAASAAHRYPVTSSRMPKAPFNWVHTVAFKGSSVYDETPVRTLVNGAGAELDPNSDAVRDFHEMVNEAQLDVVLPDFDRVRYLAKSAIVYVHSDSIGAIASGKPARTVVDVVWPQDLFVIPHPAAPTNMQAALRVLWRTGDACGPGERSFMDWRRDVVLDKDRNIVAFGAWRVDLVTERTTVTPGFLGNSISSTVERKVLWETYPLKRLPFFVCSKGRPSGRPFMPGAGGVKDLANVINSGIMSEMHTVDMTAAPVLVHTSDRPQPSVVAIGPGIKVNLSKGETLDSVTQTSDLAGMRASNSALLENLALTENQRPGSFTGNDGVESGVALKIKSIPAEKARREDKNQLRPFEEEEFLPGLIEVHDHFRGTSIADAAAKIRVDFQDPPDFESKPERQTRLAEAVDIGWIEAARGATDAGYYPTEAEALTAITKIRAEKAKAAASMLALTSAPSEKVTPSATPAPVLADTDDDGN